MLRIRWRASLPTPDKLRGHDFGGTFDASVDMTEALVGESGMVPVTLVRASPITECSLCAVGMWSDICCSIFRYQWHLPERQEQCKSVPTPEGQDLLDILPSLRCFNLFT